MDPARCCVPDLVVGDLGLKMRNRQRELTGSMLMMGLAFRDSLDSHYPPRYRGRGPSPRFYRQMGLAASRALFHRESNLSDPGRENGTAPSSLASLSRGTYPH